MSDIFVSYKREDEARVARLVAALEKAGLQVWWDRALPGGESWRANIEAALNEARCVIVCWTRASVGPAGDFVRDEAGQAKSRGILVPVLLEPGVAPPLGFGETQAVDLSRWRGRAKDPYFLDLVASVRAKLEGGPTPRVRGPAARLARQFTYGGVASASAAGLIAFSMNTFGVQDHACAIPNTQPSLSDACGALRLGHRPTHEERLAFEALPPGDCQALSVFRRRYEGSPLRAVADSRLADRRPAPEPRWSPRTVSVTMFQPQTSTPQPSEPAARQAALAAAPERALRTCRALSASGVFRVRGAAARAETWTCEHSSAGYACSFEGVAECAVDQRETVYLCGVGP